MALQMDEDADLDPCEVLGVGLDAPEKDVIFAYRKASLKCHPDRCPGDPEAAAKFSRLCRAKDVLLDPKKRAGFLAAKQRAELESVRAKARQQRDAPTMKVMYHRTSGGSEKSSSVHACSPTKQEAATAPAVLHSKQRGFCDVRKVDDELQFAASAPTPQRASPTRCFFEIRSSPIANMVKKEVDPREAEEEKERERRAIERLENAKKLVEEREKKKIEEAQERQKKHQESLERAKLEVERRENEKREKQAAEMERKERLKRDREQKKETDRLDKERQEIEKRERQQQEKERKEREKKEKVQKQKDALEKLGWRMREEKERERKAPEQHVAEAGLTMDEVMGVSGSSADGDVQMAAENTNDLSCSRPLKRKAPFTCSISYQSAKQTCKEKSLAEQVRDFLESTDYELPDVTRSCRQMLAAVCKDVVIPPSPERHHFQVEMLEMIGETLSAIREVLDERAAIATRAQEAAAEENETRSAEIVASLEDARNAYESKKLDISERAAALSKDKETLAEIRVAEKTAAARVDELATKQKECAEGKAAASKAQQTFNSLVENGTPSKAVESKKMLKEVETYMKIMKVDETLVWRVQEAVIPALQRKPDDRQGMDDMAISGMEGCFATYVEEKEEELNAFAEQFAAARERLKKLRAEIDARRQKSDQDAELQRVAKEEVRKHDASIKEAERALQEHQNMVAQAAAEAQGQVSAAASFGRLLQSFFEIAE